MEMNGTIVTCFKNVAKETAVQFFSMYICFKVFLREKKTLVTVPAQIICDSSAFVPVIDFSAWNLLSQVWRSFNSITVIVL